MDDFVNGIPAYFYSEEEREMEARLQDDPEAMLRLIDLLFLGCNDRKDLPS